MRDDGKDFFVTDADGNKYDFAFGLNWKGVINDDRTQKYGK
jgi:beta-glucosidase